MCMCVYLNVHMCTTCMQEPTEARSEFPSPELEIHRHMSDTKKDQCAGEMAQWLRVFTALAEAWNSVPSTHIASHNRLQDNLKILYTHHARFCPKYIRTKSSMMCV